MEENSLIKHAWNEFKINGWCDENGNFEDDMQEAICNHVLELLRVFSDEHHSGFSAPYALNLFKTLTSFGPIGPITGSEEEWGEPINEEGTQQNRRLHSVFKDNDGTAYYLDGFVFIGKTSSFTSNNVKMHDGSTIKSSVNIKFPFTPKTFYVHVEETEWADKEETVEKEGGGWWTSVVKDEREAEEALKYFNGEE